MASSVACDFSAGLPSAFCSEEPNEYMIDRIVWALFFAPEPS